MRVSCTEIDEFLECLRGVGDIFEDTVRVSITRNPIDGNKRSAIKFDVTLLASAVVFSSDDSQYLLEVGVSCGVDYMDEDEREGSLRADLIKSTLKEFANQKGWHVQPGVISI